jgi:DNA-binding NarL/FixJ family response regulator
MSPEPGPTAAPTADDDTSDAPSGSRLADLVVATTAREGWRASAALIERRWDQLATTAPRELLDAIRSLPAAALVDRPALLVAAHYLQSVVLGGDPGRFDEGGWVEAAMRGGKSSLLDTLSLLTAKSANARTAGRRDDAVRAAEAARASLDAAPECERAAIRISLPHLRLQWGRAFELADAPGAEVEYEAAYELAVRTEQTMVARRAAAQRAWLHAERGRLTVAELWLARARDLPAGNGRYDAVIYLASALIRLDRGDRVGARGELARASGLGSGEYWAAVAWVDSMVAADPATAAVSASQLAQHLKMHPETLASTGSDGRHTRAARARLTAIRGRSRGTTIEIRPLVTTDSVVAAAIAHSEGRHREAIELARSAAEQPEHPRAQSAALLITAAATVRLGLRGTAADVFAQAHALIEHERLGTAYECVLPDDLALLATIGGVAVPEMVSPYRTRSRDSSPLSSREQEILGLLDQGATLREIADVLFISVNTVKSTTTRIYRKLGAGSRAEAIDTAKRDGVI